MTVRYSDHLKFRIKIRKINRLLPKRIVEEAKEVYFDRETEHFIAIRMGKYAGKVRPMVAVFDKTDGDIEIITVYPTDEKEILSRIKSGRWFYEKDKN